MTDIFVTKVKTPHGFALMPAHNSDLDLMRPLPGDRPLRCKITQPRNVDHHRKYFALLNYAFECWEPSLESDPGRPELTIHKSFDRFRKDIIILAGFYEASYRLNGDVRFEAKSIAFGNMPQEEFEELYSKTIDVIIDKVMTGYTGDELREIVDQIMEFA